MSNFNLSSALSALKTGLSFVNTLMPVATAAGAPTGMLSNAVKITAAVVETAQNIGDRIADGRIAATSSDQSELKSILISLQAQNDKLKEYIATH